MLMITLFFISFSITVFILSVVLLGKHNILIIGAGDCRHILKTIARAYRHDKRDLCVSLNIKFAIIALTDLHIDQIEVKLNVSLLLNLFLHCNASYWGN